VRVNKEPSVMIWSWPWEMDYPWTCWWVSQQRRWIGSKCSWCSFIRSPVQGKQFNAKSAM